MNGPVEFDERQLEIRSKVFQRGFFLLLTMIITNTFLYNIGIIWTVDNWSYFIIAMLVLSFCLIELIFRDVAFSPRSMKRVSRMMILIGIMGLCLLVFCITAPAHVGFFENNLISPIGGGIITGAMFLTIGVVFVVKQHYNHKKIEE